MADLKRVDAIMMELCKEVPFRALGQMVANAAGVDEREQIEKRARTELSRILRTVYWPKES